jgi:hypothetical protein
LVDDDRRVYLELPHAQAQHFGFRVGDCRLMTNMCMLPVCPRTGQHFAELLAGRFFCKPVY